jgi:hypothetical protein
MSPDTLDGLLVDLAEWIEEQSDGKINLDNDALYAELTAIVYQLEPFCTRERNYN